MKTHKYFSLVIILLFLNCSYESESDLYEDSTNELPVNTTVTYTEHIKPIIDSNCTGCHSTPPTNGAPMSLTTYQSVKNAVQNDGLIQIISSQDPGSMMPPGGPRLPQNKIDLIIQWQTDGLIQ